MVAVRHFQVEVAQGHERFAKGPLELLDRRVGLLVLAGKDKLPDRGQMREGAVIVRVVRFAGPEGVFVELDKLLGDSAINHAAQPAVADGERLDKLRGRLTIPEREIRGGRVRRVRPTGNCGHGNKNQRGEEPCHSKYIVGE